MRKICSIIMVAILALLLVSCSNSAENKSSNTDNAITNTVNNEETTKTTDGQSGKTASAAEAVKADNAEMIDLTKLSSTVMYSELYNMMVQPDSYVGKTVKMRGKYAVYEGEGRNYYVCEVQDATACCNQGLEFILKDSDKYPEYNPELPVEIELTGVFNTYTEKGESYFQLEDASIIVLE